MRKILFILGVLSEEDVDWLGSAGRVIRPAAGDVLIRQGEPARDLFLVLQGHVDVSIAGVGSVSRLGAGEMVGEMSFVDAAPPAATVHAEADAVVLAVPRDALTEQMARDPRFAARFYRAIAMFLSDRLRAMSGTAGGSALEEGELDDSVLDTLSGAGLRFEMLLKRLAPVS